MKENTSKTFPEILDPDQQKALLKLQPILKDFVLGGGTALALQIKHRRSFDFDFFTKNTLGKNLLENINRLGFSFVETVFDTENELSLILEQKVKVTFLSYPFPCIFEQVFSDQIIKLFSLPGLAAQKAYTVGRRGVWRDYYDIFSLLSKDYFSLEEIIKLASNEYGDIFNSKLFLSQLVYFDDIHDFEIEPIDNGLAVMSQSEVKSFLEKEVKSYMENMK